MARYTVDRTHDRLGDRYTSGPLRFYDGDDLGQAQHEVIARGGEVIDHENGMGWTPGAGWFKLVPYEDGSLT